ncbi:restriction endonuclease subunit S [Intestinimonas massiliensis (ex Afouda et al. 2020)]|uniref:restriction endonuclease subunit S n=2 Tax=Eubacteriales TaxID=186802 RepID=UPI000A77E286|nr:restriction endonuclease subunit S [Intestinimonas massiliensis (ex Afouda et al. 2020)]
MGYETYRIADLIDEIAMGPFGSNIKVSCFVDSGVPVLNGSNLEGFSLSEKTFRYVTRKKADSLNKANAHRGDIVITHRGTLGQIVFIPQDSKYDRYVISQSQFRVRCNDKVLPEYLVYYFHTPIGQHKLLSNASQVGVPALARPSSTFQQIEVVLPELSIQKCVVEIISTIQKKIVNNQELNDNLEQQAQSYFQELFVDNADPEWAIGTISDLGTVVGGSTPSKAEPEYYTESGIAWITPKDLSINKSKFVSHGENDITELGLKNSSAAIMPEGTVLFSSRAPIGYIAIAAGEVTTNQGFKSVVPKPEIGTPFVYFFLKNTLPVIEGMASGSTFKEVSGSTMKNVPAVIPDAETLAKFSDFCAPIFAQQRILEEQNQSLATLRDNLLPKLMSGEIDVSAVQL